MTARVIEERDYPRSPARPAPARRPSVAASLADCERCRPSSKEATREHRRRTHHLSRRTDQRRSALAEGSCAETAPHRARDERAGRRPAIIVGTAIAATGWLVGSPAPKSVKSDFGSYAPQLGFNPQPGKAVLVASKGEYQLYATTNKQGGNCILVSAPWKRPGPNGEGGDCSKSQNSPSPFWAGLGGAAGHRNGTHLVIDGRTPKPKPPPAVRRPDHNTLKVPVGTSGFFIVGITTHASWCQIANWTPLVTILDSSGKQLATAKARIGHNCLPVPADADGHQRTRPQGVHDPGHRPRRPTGYIAGARLGDQITCRWAGHSVTLNVPIHGAHTAALTAKVWPSTPNQRNRQGRVFVVCG